MGKLPSIPWWSSMRRCHSDDAAADTDYADMGTAFGLDASLGPDEAPSSWEDDGDTPAAERCRRAD
ncbi:MAG TPA: hypothetical protein VFZ93_08060 [Albitalea sp.]